MSVFSGLSAFPVTPADDHGCVDCDALGSIVSRLAATEVTSIGALGSTGSYMYLTLQQRFKALEAIIEAAGDKPVVASVGAMRSSDVCTLIKHAEKSGAGGVLLAPVSYLPLTDADVTALFEDAASTTGLPVCFYNNPITTHFGLTEELLIKLGKQGLVAAVKNPPPGDLDFNAQVERLSVSLPAGFSIGYSGDSKIAAALGAGCDGWYSVLAGTLPDIAIALWQARNSIDELHRLNSKLAPLWSLFDEYGSIRVVHEIVRMQGYPRVKLPRPLLPLPLTACNQIETVIQQLQQRGRVKKT